MKFIIKDAYKQEGDWIEQKGHETCPEWESSLETNKDANDEGHNDDDQYFS